MPADMYRQGRIPLFLSDFECGSPNHVTGAVHQNIDAPEITYRGINDFFRANHGGDTIETGYRLAACFLDFSRSFFGKFDAVGTGAEIIDNDAGAFRG